MPILILTARNQWEERVDAIEAGADDYLVKPFHLEELIARLRAVIRRTNGLAGSSIAFGAYKLDTRLMQLTTGEGVPIELTPQEYKTLAYLAFHRGQVVSQLELTEHLYQQDFERNSNSIEVLVGRLRRAGQCHQDRRFSLSLGGCRLKPSPSFLLRRSWASGWIVAPWRGLLSFRPSRTTKRAA